EAGEPEEHAAFMEEEEEGVLHRAARRRGKVRGPVRQALPLLGGIELICEVDAPRRLHDRLRLEPERLRQADTVLRVERRRSAVDETRGIRVRARVLRPEAEEG